MGIGIKQLSLIPEIMEENDITNILREVLNAKLPRQYYDELKQFLLANFCNNDIAKVLFECIKIPLNESSYKIEQDLSRIQLFQEDPNTLFSTSKSQKFYILKKYSKWVSKELADYLKRYLAIFNGNQSFSAFSNVIDYDLENYLMEYIDKYLGLSKTDATGLLEKGSTCECYRLGDYVLRLFRAKWSYEEIICPNLYLIIKNLEEIYVRDKDGVIKAGLEVQQYLAKEASGLPTSYFVRLKTDLNTLGYYTTDTLMNGSCGDNCRILNDYHDADCLDPEILSDYFKETPLVIIDRDRIYPKGKNYIKQLRDGGY